MGWELGLSTFKRLGEIYRLGGGIKIVEGRERLFQNMGMHIKNFKTQPLHCLFNFSLLAFYNKCIPLVYLDHKSNGYPAEIPTHITHSSQKTLYFKMPKIML